MSQCVSCNNQPSDNDSLGGGAHEGAVTPMVVGIIAGTVVVFVLVLCALFYCAKLENEKMRRGAAHKAEGDCAGPPATLPPRPPPPPPQQQQQQQQQQHRRQLSRSSAAEDEGVEMLDGGGGGYGPEHDRRSGQVPRDQADVIVKSGPVERPSSLMVVAGEAEDARGRVLAATTRSSGPGGVRKKGPFGWGGGRKSSGRATPADNPPVTAMEMV